MKKIHNENLKKEFSAKLTQGEVGRTLIRLTLPMILGIMSMVAFNLADTFFVSRLGTQALAALSFTFPVVLVVNSLSLGLGIGASAVISRAFGEGDREKVRRLTTDSIALSLIIVILFTAIGRLTIRPLFQVLGAEGDILPLIEQYMRIWYFGAVFVVVPMVGNNAIRASGDAKTPGLIMLNAAIFNVILDYLLVFGIGPFPRLGIAGAALATVIARAMSLTISFTILHKRERMLTLRFIPLKTILRSWAYILYIALPASSTRVVIPLGMGVITRLISKFGPEAVAGYGVANRIEFFAGAVIMALSSILGPFIGQNWGAKSYARVKKSIAMSQRFALIWGLAMCIVLVIYAKGIAAIFDKDPRVISSIVSYLHIVTFGYGLYGILIISNAALNVLRKPLHAATLSISQVFLFSIPLAYLGSKIIGLQGLFGGILVSYILSGVAAYTILRMVYIGLTKKQPHFQGEK